GMAHQDLIESLLGDLQQGAVSVGNDVRRTRAFIEERDLAKKIPGLQRRQNGLPVLRVQADADLAAQNEVHAIAVLLQANDDAIGLYLHRFHQPGELQDLLV